MAGMARESMMPLTTRPDLGGRHRQAEDRDIVEVVADFADDLAHPRVAVVAVLAQQRERKRSTDRLLPNRDAADEIMVELVAEARFVADLDGACAAWSPPAAG